MRLFSIIIECLFEKEIKNSICTRLKITNIDIIENNTKNFADH